MNVAILLDLGSRLPVRWYHDKTWALAKLAPG
jgi:hypothetical protein